MGALFAITIFLIGCGLVLAILLAKAEDEELRRDYEDWGPPR